MPAELDEATPWNNANAVRNGVTLTLPGDTEPEILAGYVRIKV